jgi:hypothetical protein
MWKLNKSIVKDMLPVQPVIFPLEPWWAVGVVNLTVEEYRVRTDYQACYILLAAVWNTFVLDLAHQFLV